MTVSRHRYYLARCVGESNLRLPEPIGNQLADDLLCSVQSHCGRERTTSSGCARRILCLRAPSLSPLWASVTPSFLPSPSSLHVRGNFLDSWQSRERATEGMEVGNREGWEDGSKEGRTRDRRAAARLFCLTAPFKVRRRRRGPLFHGEGPTVLKGDGGD